jgi:hypothetical protein
LLEENAFIICIRSPSNKFAALALCGCSAAEKFAERRKEKQQTHRQPTAHYSLGEGLSNTLGDKRKVKLEREKTTRSVSGLKLFLYLKPIPRAHHGLRENRRGGRARANKKTKQEWLDLHGEARRPNFQFHTHWAEEGLGQKSRKERRKCKALSIH